MRKTNSLAALLAVAFATTASAQPPATPTAPPLQNSCSMITNDNIVRWASFTDVKISGAFDTITMTEISGPRGDRTKTKTEYREKDLKEERGLALIAAFCNEGTSPEVFSQAPAEPAKDLDLF